MDEIIRQRKLENTALEEGFDNVDEFLLSVIGENIVPGVCINENCHFSRDVGPTTRHAFCGACEDDTVTSVLVVAKLL